MSNRSIVINGDLGSGKSTIARLIAERTGLAFVSIGDLYRQIAHSRGMSALELNLHAERDAEIDRYVDDLQRKMADSDEQMVVDSRLAWVFFRQAFKVHLITDPSVAAARVLSRPADKVESYGSLAEATRSLQVRSESERQRFVRKYGVDKSRLRNYDMICDTTRTTATTAADCIIESYTAHPGSRPADATPVLLIDPARIYPTKPIERLAAGWRNEPEFVSEVGRRGFRTMEPITLGFTGSAFFVTEGHRRLSAALQNGFELIAAVLAAERAEPVADGTPAASYLDSAVTSAVLDGWNEAHGLHLSLPPAPVPPGPVPPGPAS